MRKLIIPPAAGLVLTATAGACTLCDSGTGIAVRTGITQDFWTNLGMVMAPFIGTFLVLALGYLLVPRLCGAATTPAEEPRTSP